MYNKEPISVEAQARAIAAIVGHDEWLRTETRTNLIGCIDWNASVMKQAAKDNKYPWRRDQDIKGNRVHMKPFEMRIAAAVGSWRRVLPLVRGSSLDWANSTSTWDQVVNGEAAEMVVAKLANMYPFAKPVDTYKEPDLPPNIQVRHTNTGKGLFIRERDNLDHFYVLVTGSNGDYVVHGGCFGYQANELGNIYTNKRMGAPCIVVPRTRLVGVAPWQTQRRDG